jgi:hypothetical protein
MLVTNQTTQDYWFGPLRSPEGLCYAPQGSVFMRRDDGDTRHLL